MDLTSSLRSLLLSNHQPLGVVLGTPRAQLKRPDWFRPATMDDWSFATGVFEGAEVVWNLDRGMLSEARAVFSSRGNDDGFFGALLELFTEEFGKAKLMKRSEERTWALKTATLPSALSVSRRVGGSAGTVMVVQLTLAKGQKLPLPPKPADD